MSYLSSIYLCTFRFTCNYVFVSDRMLLAWLTFENLARQIRDLSLKNVNLKQDYSRLKYATFPCKKFEIHTAVKPV